MFWHRIRCDLTGQLSESLFVRARIYRLRYKPVIDKHGRFYYNNCMKLPDMEKVKEIATRVRAGVEKFVPTINDKVNGLTEDLTCFCAISSHALVTALKKNGIEARLVVGFFDENEDWDYNDDNTEQFQANHCWVEVAFSYVDITATQFHQYSDEKVLIISNDECESLYYPYETPKSIKNMQGHKRRNRWGRQAPQMRYTKKILALAGI